jgi:hypothetical protein
MLLGILLMLLGVSLGIGIMQAIALRIGISFDAINSLPIVSAIIIIAGFIIGLVGFFQRSE